VALIIDVGQLLQDVVLREQQRTRRAPGSLLAHAA